MYFKNLDIKSNVARLKKKSKRNAQKSKYYGWQASGPLVKATLTATILE